MQHACDVEADGIHKVTMLSWQLVGMAVGWNGSSNNEMYVMTIVISDHSHTAVYINFTYADT